MHKIFISEGIVLRKSGVGEANIKVSILTKEIGLVCASAKSARVEKSKLRYGLEPITQGTFSFVRGRFEWKLTGVNDVSQKFITSSIPSDRRVAAGRVVKLLLRLVQGEEPVPALYESVVEGLEFLTAPEIVSKRSSDFLSAGQTSPQVRPFSQQSLASHDTIEIILVLRILAHLGYLPQSTELDSFIRGDLFSIELAASAARSRSALIRTINTSLESTGL